MRNTAKPRLPHSSSDHVWAASQDHIGDELGFGAKRREKCAGEDLLSHPIPVVHEKDRPQDRAGQLFGTQVLLYAPFALEVVYPCVAVGAADGAVE